MSASKSSRGPSLRLGVNQISQHRLVKCSHKEFS